MKGALFGLLSLCLCVNAIILPLDVEHLDKRLPSILTQAPVRSPLIFTIFLKEAPNRQSSRSSACRTSAHARRSDRIQHAFGSE